MARRKFGLGAQAAALWHTEPAARAPVIPDDAEVVPAPSSPPENASSGENASSSENSSSGENSSSSENAASTEENSSSENSSSGENPSPSENAPSSDGNSSSSENAASTEGSSSSENVVSTEENSSSENASSDGNQSSENAASTEGSSSSENASASENAASAEGSSSSENASPSENAASFGGNASADFSIAEGEFAPPSAAVAGLPEGVSLGEGGQLLVEVSRLRANPEQPRTEFDPALLEELASSIREHGVLQPITVEDAGDGTFYIIAGERRTRAARLAGLQRIPAQLRRYDDQKKLEVALIENIQRADLNAVEEARAYQRLMQLSGLSQEQVGARVGKNRATVANSLRLLRLPSDMQDALVSGEISAGHARALLSVKEAHDQRLLFSKIVGGGLSVRKAERMANDLNFGAGRQARTQAAAERDPDLAEVEQKFIEAFGTKVSISGSLEKGVVEISYFSREDLDRLYGIVVREG